SSRRRHTSFSRDWSSDVCSSDLRLLTRNAAERKQAGERCDVEAGMAKLFASETALELATEAMRIHGGVGYTTDLPVERYYRDAPDRKRVVSGKSGALGRHGTSRE